MDNISFSSLKAIAIIVVAFTFRLILETRKRQSRNPHKRLVSCFLDTLCAYPKMFGISPWNKQHDIYIALKNAKQITGLTDLGGDDQKTFIERYNVTRNIGLQRCKAAYTPLGELMLSRSIQQRMVTRLTSMDYLKRHPSIEKIQLKPPIFVIGFPSKQNDTA